MILAVDIGNSAIKFGLFEGETLTSKFSIPSKKNAHAREIRREVGDKLAGSFSSAIVCSVVPEIENGMRSFLRDTIGTEPVFVNNSFNFGLGINYEPLDSLGTDRLVAAFAAVEKYGAPVIACSLGTATTIDVVNKDREFLGGIIAPGLNLMAAALYMNASRLPHVQVEKPESLLGTSTDHSIRSGVFNGYVSMFRGLIEMFRSTIDAKAVATGGNAELIANECDSIDVVDPDLVLSGLSLLSQRGVRKDSETE